MQITKERLEFIRDNAYSEERREMARQLLASMEQEPVGITDRSEIEGLKRGEVANVMPPDFKGVDAGDEVLLYAAPQLPRPAVPDEWRMVCGEWRDETVSIHDASGLIVSGISPNVAGIIVEAHNACRAAMLQGAEPVRQPLVFFDGDISPEDAEKIIARLREMNSRPGSQQVMIAEPVSQPDELPMDYLQGHKDGLEWAARLAEANHPQTGDWLYDDPLELAKAIRKGPDMPVEPVQGWIPCGERVPEEIGRYWCYVEEQNSLGKSHYQWNCSWNGDRWWVESENGGRVTHWMPLQEPPKQTPES